MWETSTSNLYNIKPKKSAHNGYKKYEVKLSMLRIGSTILIHGQKCTMEKPESWQLEKCPQWSDSRRKWNIHGNLKKVNEKELWSGETNAVSQIGENVLKNTGEYQW